MPNAKSPPCLSVHVNPLPNYEDSHPIKDSYYHRIIKAGDKVRCWLSMGHGTKDLRLRFVEGIVEEIDGILWIRTLRSYTAEKGYEKLPDQGPYKLVNNFVNRCYSIAIINKENIHKLAPIKKVNKEVK